MHVLRLFLLTVGCLILWQLNICESHRLKLNCIWPQWLHPAALSRPPTGTLMWKQFICSDMKNFYKYHRTHCMSWAWMLSGKLLLCSLIIFKISSSTKSPGKHRAGDSSVTILVVIMISILTSGESLWSVFGAVESRRTA